MGSGHVMRCLTLADALKARGARCQFICREHEGNLLEYIRQRGFVTYGLPAGSEDSLAATDNSRYNSNNNPRVSTDWATDKYKYTCTCKYKYT